MSRSLWPRTRGLALRALALLACTLLACDRKKEAASPARPGEAAAPEASAPSSDGKAPWTMAELSPVIREVGEAGVVPGSVAIEFAQPVTGRANDPVPAGTVVEVEPKTAGDLRFNTPSTLVFEPRQGFAPDTRYTVTLKALKTQSGAVPQDAPIHYTFKTPSFLLVRASYARFDPGKRRLEIDLEFSAPVDLTSVKENGRFAIKGAPIGRISYEATYVKNVVRATLVDPRIEYGRTVVYSQGPRVRAAADSKLTAPAASEKIVLNEGETLSIYTSVVEEGANGFHVTVVCRDEAVSKETQYYWANGNGYQVSSRCVLEESDAAESVHITPPVKFEIAPTRGGFRILGDFKRGSYSLRIDANARSADGGVLKTPYEVSFSVPARKPQVSFVAQGRYLPKDAWQSLAIRHLNLSNVELTVRSVPPENLMFWMSGEEETANERTSSVLLKKTIPVRGQPDELTTSWIDLRDLLRSPPPGLLQLEVSAPGAAAHARVLLTDLNLIAKRSASTGKVEVWAIDMHGDHPVPGVLIRQVLMSGRLVSSCSTDRDGRCLLGGKDSSDPDPAEPYALIASREGDLTYLKYADLKLETADAAVQGRPFTADAPYRAAIYSDRGVYRPGDTVRLAAIVRGQDDLAPPEGMPVEVQLLDPKKKVTRKLVRKTNAAGFLDVDLKFDDYADTGRWEVALEAGKKPLGQYGFSVEEFVPERMKVTARAEKAEALISDKVPIAVQAQYLFGGSAAGSRVELSCELQPARFAPKANANFEYGIWREKDRTPKPLTVGSASGEIDAKGGTSIACPALNGRGGFSGTARLSAKVGVFESGSGRTTQGEATAMIHPERFYVGLSANVTKAKAGQPFTVEGVVVDWTGALVTDVAQVRLELYRVQSEYDWATDDNGEWSYRHYTHLSSDGKLPPVSVKNGKFSVAVTPGTGAEGFVVRARAGAAQTDLSLEGDEPYWWWSDENGRDQTPRPQKAASVPLSVPGAIKVGQKGTAEFVAPFKGKALMTVETDRVIQHEWVDAQPGRNEWTFTVPEFVPNVYVGALIVKDPHAESKSAFLPSRAFGVASVRVEPEPFARGIKLDVPTEVRSNGKLEVKLDLGKLDEPTFVTVAAVDEGILSLTRFKSPDPLATIFDPRALGILTYETIGWNLILPALGPSRSPGGDQAGGGGRVQPVKPVALWSGIVPVPANGKATVTFDVPSYRGSLRVMAVSAGKKRLGSASANVYVRDPLVIQTTIPRFLTQGDEVDVPVFLTNMSGRALHSTVALSADVLPVAGVESTRPLAADDVIQVIGPAKKTLDLVDGQSETAVFRLKALATIGAAKINVRAQAGDLQSSDSLDVPFLPAAPRTREIQRVELREGDNDLRAHLTGWLPTTERTTVWVTGNPFGESFQHLGYLIHYPYGCIEQTTSGTRALLYAAKLVGSVDPSLVAKVKVEDMVTAGLARILSMQTPSGGFGYWPHDQEPNPWGTAYATHFLLDAQKQRFVVPEERLKDALDWIGNALTNHYERRTSEDEPEWGYWRGAEAYLHFVLAEAGRGRKARIERLIEQERGRARDDSEHAERLYMLEAALYLAGDHRYENELKDPDISNVVGLRRNSWSFYSDRRRRGFMLSTFIDLFGRDPAGEKLANVVAEGLREHESPYYTTQEIAWGVSGLGKWVGETASFKSAALAVNGKAVTPDPASVDPKSSDRSWALARASEVGALNVRLEQPAGKVYAILASEGVKSDAKYSFGGEGIALTRTWVDAHGEPLNLAGGKIQLGDVIYVRIAITNHTSEPIHNVALVDRFPAGWEIENPRLGRGATSFDWLDPQGFWTFDNMNIRDDRLEVFGRLDAGKTQEVVYALRAVSAGAFTVPPVEAVAMYYPENWARQPGGRATVGAPWKRDKE